MAALLQPCLWLAEATGQRPYTDGLRKGASMAASRLSDSQKQELVQRFRQGETSADLAAAFGCSPNTVSRTVKAALEPAEYEQLKQQQRARSAVVSPVDPVVDPAPAVPAETVTVADDPALEAEAEPDDAAVLAIDDADDFGDDDDSTDEDAGDDEVDAALPVLPLSVNHEPVQVQALMPAVLPESLYMLVDKTVELQARPLKDFAELGQLPPEEEERQALQLFVNPRQAKRQCGRSQRVIKMPDSDVLLRRAAYLQVKGISRLVVEGTLYALPGN